MGDESARPTRSSVLRLRGLPFAATESDIEEFFKGFQLKQVQICKRNGEGWLDSPTLCQSIQRCCGCAVFWRHAPPAVASSLRRDPPSRGARLWRGWH